jgi:rubrerythrin
MMGFLNDCFKVEKTAAAIYEHLAREHSYSPRICEVFRQLAKDEHQHAEQIGVVINASSQELDAVPAVAGKVIDAAVQAAQDMSDSLERGPLSEEQALRLAVQMEKQFALVHVDSAVHFHNPKVKALFAKLSSEDQTHIDRLRDCLEWWKSERRPQTRTT